MMGKLEEAEPFYLDALPLFGDSPYHDGELYCREKLGFLLWRKADYSGALEQYEEATKLCKQVRIDPSEAADYLFNAGEMHVNLGENQQAWGCFEHALDLFTGNSDKLGQARCLGALANVLLLRRQTDEAMQKYDEALKLCEGSGPSSELAFTYWGMGEVCNQGGRKDDAIRWMEMAAESYELAEDADLAEEARSMVEEWRQNVTTQQVSPARARAPHIH
jgi:tetratricopeptide (TPR) repeat protein